MKHTEMASLTLSKPIPKVLNITIEQAAFYFSGVVPIKSTEQWRYFKSCKRCFKIEKKDVDIPPHFSLRINAPKQKQN